MPLLSRCCFVRHRVTSSCKSAILDRWMRAFVDRSPLDYCTSCARCAALRAGLAFQKPRLWPLAYSSSMLQPERSQRREGCCLVSLFRSQFRVLTVADSSHFFNTHFVMGLLQCVRSVQAAPVRVNASRLRLLPLQCLLRCQSVLWFLARFGSRRQVLSQ